jgi:flagellar hook-associated protein 3 FlgL
MTRVSTADGWNSALLDLMRAQTRQMDAQHQVSTQKKAVDLKGFGRESETLAAFRSAQLRLNGFLDVSKAVASRLTTQDVALNQIADSAQSARDTIADALAAGRGDGLMLALQQRFQSAVDGLNAKHQGRYLFGGARADQPPVTADTLTDLTAGPAISTFFQNDQLKTVSRIDEASTIQTGFLANELGEDLFTVFQAIQAFSTGPSGPFSGSLTQTQKDFLATQLTALDAARDALVDQAAQNGAMQTRVESHITAQEAQGDALEGLIGDRTDVDMAEAISKLQQSQLAVQASAQVLASLKDMSLLDLLR